MKNSQQKKSGGILFYNPALFPSLPMGTLGLCDYISKHVAGKPRIFHAGLYDETQVMTKFTQAIHKYSPQYFGIILHWKETLQECLTVANILKKNYPDRMIVVGGITAGFMAAELLNHFPFIDLVIKGDAEKPLRMLLKGAPLKQIPNGIYRENRQIQTNGNYRIGKKTLNLISFSNLEYLLDADAYIERTKKLLGFPVFIGRGCPYNCLYCGGSSKAFKVCTQNEYRPVTRSIKALLEDLRMLRQYTNRLYICYEPDVDYMKTLFRAIIKDNTLTKQFILNYGTWQLIDQEFLDLYKSAFRYNHSDSPIFEISPETSIERDRKVIRDKKLYFNNQQMLDCVKAIQASLNNSARIQIFFSRYHITQDSKTKLHDELEHIHYVMEYFYRHSKLSKVGVSFTHLSTDVGSHYWDETVRSSGKTDATAILLENIRKWQQPTFNEHLLSNLCIYVPPSLDKKTVFAYEQVIKLMTHLRTKCHVYYFYITKAVGIRRFIAILDDIVKQSVRKGRYHMFQTPHPVRILDKIHQHLRNRYPTLYESNPAYFDDLQLLWSRILYQQMMAPSAPGEYLQEDPIRIIDKPKLVKERLIITRFPYLTGSFYQALDKGVTNLIPRQVINVLFNRKVKMFDYAYYRFFRMLNGKNTLEEIHEKMITAPNLDIFEMKLVDHFIQKKYHYFTR